MRESTCLQYPAFGICGYSGSGKTTLIEAVLRQLQARGLRAGVIKQDAHGLQLDREGKDTDRIFKAGADVFIRDDTQAFARCHRRGEEPLPRLIRKLGPHYDLILVEGHKATPLPCKIWLCKAGEETAPPDVPGIQRVLGWTEDRARIVMDMIDAWLPGAWADAPLYAGILFGGGSTRMGRAKHLIEDRGETWLQKAINAVQEHVARVVLLGCHRVPEHLRTLPVLADVEDSEGPLRGMLAAMRWAPLASWIFMPCDVPLASPDAIRWLLSHRHPGTWAVLPALPDSQKPQPLPGYYDFRAAALLEAARGPSDCAGHEKTARPTVPPAFAGAWKSMNSPSDIDGQATAREDGLT